MLTIPHGHVSQSVHQPLTILLLPIQVILLSEHVWQPAQWSDRLIILLTI